MSLAEWMATRRWKRNNAAVRAANLCACGEPATRITANHWNLGTVPAERAVCARHCPDCMFTFQIRDGQKVLINEQCRSGGHQ